MTPCFLCVALTNEGYVDENGNKHPGTTTFEDYIKCDVVPAGQANQRDFGDGILQTYSYTIYVHDKCCKDFMLGETIKFKKNGVLSGEFLVKGFHRYQHQCKIWV